MEHPFKAFMSYARFDDEHDKGKLSEFRALLSGEVRAQTGKEFPIFQDKINIKWGDNWKNTLLESLDVVLFFIPIITPSFFASPTCREELEIFIAREKKLSREDLIFPVYYIYCSNRADDNLAEIIFSRQFADFRQVRLEDINSLNVKKIINKLALDIRASLSAQRNIALSNSISDREVTFKSEVPEGVMSMSVSENASTDSAHEDALDTMIPNGLIPPGHTFLSVRTFDFIKKLRVYRYRGCIWRAQQRLLSCREKNG